MQDAIDLELKKLRDSYYDLTSLAWDCAPEECAEFASGCLDLIAEAKALLKQKFDLQNIADEHIFEYLYNKQILPTDHSPIDLELAMVEVTTDYGHYSIYTEDEDFDVQDIMSGMESLVEDLARLE